MPAPCPLAQWSMLSSSVKVSGPQPRRHGDVRFTLIMRNEQGRITTPCSFLPDLPQPRPAEKGAQLDVSRDRQIHCRQSKTRI